MRPKTEQLQIRVSPELKEKILKAAKAENRSMSNWVLKTIKQNLEEEMKNIEDIARNELIRVFPDLGEYIDADGNFENESDYKWWAKLAESMAVIEDFKDSMEDGFEKLEDIEHRMNELDEYNDLADKIRNGDLDWMLGVTPVYLVVTIDGHDEFIEYEGTDLEKAINAAEWELTSAKRAGRERQIELRELTDGYKEGGYDYNAIDYPLFSSMTYQDMRDCVEAGECRKTPGKACYYILIKKGDTEIYAEKLAEEYGEESEWEKEDEIEDDLIEMAKEKIEEMRPTK